MPQAGLLQVLGEGQWMTCKAAACAQWPQHAKQQAIDVVAGDTAKDAGSAQVCTPQLFQRSNFIGKLAQAFVDALGFATGAGGAQAQLAPIRV
ncbi:hypothetical protein D9M73_186370 [compost metagenome]